MKHIEIRHEDFEEDFDAALDGLAPRLASTMLGAPRGCNSAEDFAPELPCGVTHTL